MSSNMIIKDHASKKGCPPAGFEDLPREVRLVVLKNLVPSPAAGRTPYRNVWPITPADHRTDEQVAIDGLATVSRQVRCDVLPLIMRRHVLKLAAWTPEFKESCVDFVRSVSELFCQSVDWLWLEGAHWRLSCHLVGSRAGTRGKLEWEDERAREDSLRLFTSCETLEREGFVLRVDFVDSAREQAVDCAEDMARLVEQLVLAAGARGRLGKAQLVTLITRTALTAKEQRVGRKGVVALERVPNKFEFV